MSSHQNSLQFRYTFGAFVDPQLKFFPSGTMSKVCSRISESCSSCCCDSGGVWSSEWEKASFAGSWRVQTCSLESANDSAGNSSPSLSNCWVLGLVLRWGLRAACVGGLLLLFLFLSEEKFLLSARSSRVTCRGGEMLTVNHLLNKKIFNYNLEKVQNKSVNNL